MIDPLLTFGAFVVSPSNRLSTEAARRVAQLPGAAYNPLIIAGAAGSGKSHLLHAIANEARALRPGEETLLERADVLPPAIDVTRVRMLLIDDLDLVAASAEEQRAVVSACRAAIASGTQVVLTCRQPLTSPFGQELDQLLSEGVQVDVDATDAGLAAALLERFSAELDLTFSRDAADDLTGRLLPPGELLRTLGKVRDALATGAGEISEISMPDLERVLHGPGLPPEALFNEFASFLEDVTSVVAVAVESVPWRRKLTDAIRRWEREGVRTDHLERTLQTDLPKDVDAVIADFERRAFRLIQIRSELGTAAAGHILDDPEKLSAVEAIYAAFKAAGDLPGAAATGAGEVFRTVDPWFLDPDRLVLSAYEIDGRIPGDRR